MQVKIDRRGRVVIPLHERERLGMEEGRTFELISVPEGVLLERRQPAEVKIAEDGLPVIKLSDLERVSNKASIDAIHRLRDRR